MEMKHAITGLIIGLLVIFAAYFYKNFKTSGQSFTLFEVQTNTAKE